MLDLSAVHSTTNASSSLSSSASPWVPLRGSPSSQGAQVRNNLKKTRPGKFIVSPENTKIEYLNLELNSAKTRIAQLETTMSDYEATIKIQKDKIKVLESQRHDIISKSMNKHTQEQQPQKNTHQSCQATTACHSQHPCPSARSHCAPQPPCPCSHQAHYLDYYHGCKAQVPTSCHNNLPHDRKDTAEGDIQRREASINKISDEIVDIVCNITEIQDWQNKFSKTEIDKQAGDKSIAETVPSQANLNEKADMIVTIADVHYNENQVANKDNEIIIDDNYTQDIVRNDEEKEPTDNTNDDSVVSIDDLVPDVNTPAKNLNYQSQTSQQLLLMLD